MLEPFLAFSTQKPSHTEPEVDVSGRNLLPAKNLIGVELDIQPGDAVECGLGQVQVVPSGGANNFIRFLVNLILQKSSDLVNMLVRSATPSPPTVAFVQVLNCVIISEFLPNLVDSASVRRILARPLQGELSFYFSCVLPFLLFQCNEQSLVKR